MKIQSLLLAATVLAAGAMFAGTGAAAARADLSQSVTIDDYAFSPMSLSVSAGTTVTWINMQDDTPHTTTSLDGLWDSGLLNTGDSFSVELDTPGTFAYQCTIHPFMQGTITVQ